MSLCIHLPLIICLFVCFPYADDVGDVVCRNRGKLRQSNNAQGEEGGSFLVHYYRTKLSAAQVTYLSPSIDEFLNGHDEEQHNYSYLLEDYPVLPTIMDELFTYIKGNLL